MGTGLEYLSQLQWFFHIEMDFNGFIPLGGILETSVLKRNGILTYPYQLLPSGSGQAIRLYDNRYHDGYTTMAIFSRFGHQRLFSHYKDSVIKTIRQRRGLSILYKPVMFALFVFIFFL